MIAHVRGVVADTIPQAVVVDVHGVGYEVQVSTGDYESSHIGDEVTFFTYHHIREQAQDLFGFSTQAAKKLFELLITVQGIGPKAALAILSLGSAESVRSAIAQGDAAFVTRAAGVGKKSAERVIVDLSDKVGLPTSYEQHPVQTEINTNDEAFEALVALGYAPSEATNALNSVSHELTTAERVTEALKIGGRT